MRFKRENWAKVALLCASVVLCLALLELTLRGLFGGPPNWKFPQEFYESDSEIQHRLVPNQTAFTHDKPVRTNSFGLRGPDYAPDVADGSRRVVALGDSQTFGNGTLEKSTWPGQLEAALNAQDGRKWEVLNAGIPGTDTWQHEILLRRLMSVYDADVVVLAFYVNDVAEHRTFIDRERASQMTNTASKHIAYFLKRFALTNAVRDSLIVLRSTSRRSVKRELQIITGESTPTLIRAWESVERSLGAMKADCDASEIELVLCILPRRDQVTGARTERAYNERLARIADRYDISYIDMLDPLRMAFEIHGRALFIPWDGHNSALTNRVIAQTLAEHLTRPTTRNTSILSLAQSAYAAVWVESQRRSGRDIFQQRCEVGTDGGPRVAFAGESPGCSG